MSPIKMKSNPTQKVIHPIPPYNGFGIEEDSLFSVYNLGPAQPKVRKITSTFKTDKHILRFKGKLISRVASDTERNFIISYFCRDDTIMVFEAAHKNSGRLNAKFLERQKLKNPYTKTYYNEQNFVVGNIIFVNTYTFKLLEGDDYTKKYMIDNPEVFRDSNLDSVIIRLMLPNKDTVENYAVQVLKTIDPDQANYVSDKQIVKGFKELSVYLSDQEALTLFSALKKDENENYSVEDLYNLIINFS